MIFRQLFDDESCTYTYLIASRKGGEALIIDPVVEKTDRYVNLLTELDLRLVKAVDTHVHADHISALARLRDRTECITVMGECAKVDVVGMRVADGETIDIEGLGLDVIYTPGHTSDSYSFLFGDRVFTGDTLMIRGTGRTDFQNGDAGEQYDSIFGRLMKLADDTLVYPAHDYKGDTVSTIGEERCFNPRLQVSSKAQYVDLMGSLNLDRPEKMDIAVPANLSIGLDQDQLITDGIALEATLRSFAAAGDDYLLVDLRSACEQQKQGKLTNAIELGYSRLNNELSARGALFALIKQLDKPVLFCCGYGELSAMATRHARQQGLSNTFSLIGGVSTWLAKGVELKTD